MRLHDIIRFQYRDREERGIVVSVNPPWYDVLFYAELIYGIPIASIASIGMGAVREVIDHIHPPPDTERWWMRWRHDGYFCYIGPLRREEIRAYRDAHIRNWHDALDEQGFLTFSIAPERELLQRDPGLNRRNISIAAFEMFAPAFDWWRP